MKNFINESFDRLSTSFFAKEIMFVYSMTGKEKSIFFPLLNYAAMRIVKCNNEIDAFYEKAALECVRDNIRYIVMCRNGGFNNGFVMAKIEDVEAAENGKIFLSANTSLDFKVSKSRKNFMSTPRSVREDTAYITMPWFFMVLIRSVAHMMSKPLGEVLKRMKGEMELFPSAKIVMRTMKEYKFSGDDKCKSLRSIIDGFHGSRDVIFPITIQENFSVLDEHNICHYNTASGICWLFNERMIARLSDVYKIYAKETVDSMSIDIMHNYIEGINRVKQFISALENQRKDFLGTVTIKEH